MDFLIEWSPEALEDVELIAEYISRDSEYYARSVVVDILETARNLGDFPKAGPIVPEIGDEAIRERFLYSYRLIYRLETERIVVVAIVHGKRLLQNVPNRF